jgi:poly-gamma-glutamate capsule biosynthesis protein CapA/YwtB (metallophosphatase superfamily)
MLLGFVGDVLVDRDLPTEVFAKSRELLDVPDVLFANLESAYSDAPGTAITQPIAITPRMHNLHAFKDAGFDILSLANNHIGDAGHAAMLETRTWLESQGVRTCGAGSNLDDARKPAIIQAQGVSTGFLAYASTFPHGYQARDNVPGLAPLRAYNHYVDVPEYYAPGYIPRVETIPDCADQERFEADLAALRPNIDLVVTSFHWGDHLRPFVLTDHEIRTARLAIDLGADVVAGHHHHLLRGIEWYKGKPIFYGLGNFVFDLRMSDSSAMQKTLKEFDPRNHSLFDPDSYAVGPRDGWPLLPLHRDCRLTLLAWVKVEQKSISAAGFVPCRLRQNGQVEPVEIESEDGREVVDYVRKCNSTQRLNGELIEDADTTVAGFKSIRVIPVS